MSLLVPFQYNGLFLLFLSHFPLSALCPTSGVRNFIFYHKLHRFHVVLSFILLESIESYIHLTSVYLMKTGTVDKKLMNPDK